MTDCVSPTMKHQTNDDDGGGDRNYLSRLDCTPRTVSTAPCECYLHRTPTTASE